MTIVYKTIYRSEKQGQNETIPQWVDDTNANNAIVFGQVNSNASNISNLQDTVTTLAATATTQGNTFNGVSELVQTNASGQYPALDGSLITNILPKGYFWGFTLSKNSTTPHTDIDITQGVCQDSTNTQVITTTTTMTKRTSTAWVAGTGNGMLDTGTFAANTTYYAYVISGTAGTDFISSLSATTPALPTGYTVFKQIGSFSTDSSTYINYVSSFSTTEIRTWIASDGNSWYRKYPSGWIEQGGLVSSTTYFPVTFTSLMSLVITPTGSSGSSDFSSQLNSASTASFTAVLRGSANTYYLAQGLI